MSEKSDAATATDDMKAPPLCLFYFSHPFGILSPDPPQIAMAPRNCKQPSWMPLFSGSTEWKMTSEQKRSIKIPKTKAPKIKKDRYHDKLNEDKTYRNITTRHAFENIAPTQPGLDLREGRIVVRKQKKMIQDKIDYENKIRYLTKKHSPSYSSEGRKKNILNRILPPLDHSIKEAAPTKTSSLNWWDVNKFRIKPLLPPIELTSCVNMDFSTVKLEVDDKNISIRDYSANESSKKKKRKISGCLRIVQIKSVKGIVKSRKKSRKSATRKLVNCMLLNARESRRAATGKLPPFSEVLNTLREAWSTPKALVETHFSEELQTEKNMYPETRTRSGASPGLLRRRYSVPETVMRKYKLAQQKSDSEDSDAASAPSVRGCSPARGTDYATSSGGSVVVTRGREKSPRRALLRRLWGRVGGSHAELRTCDSRSTSTSPRRVQSPERSACESCKKIPHKDVNESPIYRNYVDYQSPKTRRKQNWSLLSHHQSPERYISQLENIRDTLAREARARKTSAVNSSSLSDRSSAKSISITDGSPKLGLSSLATSSYPASEGLNISVNDLSNNIVKSSSSCSSDEISHSMIKSFSAKSYSPSRNRPNSASDSKNSLPSTPDRKRRKSVCIYMSADIQPSGDIYKENSTENSLDSISQKTSESIQDISYSLRDVESNNNEDCNRTTTTETTTTTTSIEKSSDSRTGTSTTTSNIETSETTPPDSAMSLTSSKLSSKNTSRNNTTESSVNSPASDKNGNKNSDQKNNNEALEFSDTGISETLDDSNKNSFTTSDESINVEQFKHTNKELNEKCDIKNVNMASANFESLEVIVSETLNSTAFEKRHTENDKNPKRAEHKKKHFPEKYDKNGDIDIDQYVSNILVDSLNTMTDHINEINSNIEDDKNKLNILEKEIKVKLQSVGASPINLANSSLITSVLTIPDKDLLETTVIEEKSHTLAYTTESRLFPVESSSEILIKNKSIEINTHAKDLSLNNNNNFSHPHNNNIQNMENSMSEESLLANKVAELSIDSTISSFNNNDPSENASFYIIDEPDYNKNSTDGEVLQQLQKMFENNDKMILDPLINDVDSNFNFRLENPQTYFCGSIYRDASHTDMEMSTDVDIFVDNSLNKMMHSVEIHSSKEFVPEDNENSQLDSVENIPKIVLDKSNILSKVGTGSVYQKSSQKPVVVPRYSAIPYSESMEVNTSSDDEDDDSSCASDCLSFVDSLDDPNSPRPLKLHCIDEKVYRKHYKDIITLLPENSQSKPLEKAASFFVPIKETSTSPENLVVADRLPEKIKEKIQLRQQKRELRKEHYKRKRERLMRKEQELKRQTNAEKLKKEHVDHCSEILSNLINQVTDKGNKDIKKKQRKTEKVDLKKPQTEPAKKTQIHKPMHKQINKLQNKHSKKDITVEDFESFTFDKQGNIQLINSRKLSKSDNDSRVSTNSSSKTNKSREISSTNSSSSSNQPNIVMNNQNNDVENIEVIENETGIKRLYHKTEFKEGNRHVEILEIVECIDDSSPESQDSDDSNHLSSKKNKNSKIPLPVNEKPHKISKNKAPTKNKKTSVTKNIPANLLLAKTDPKGKRSENPKFDQLIAKILIDAFKSDSDRGEAAVLNKIANAREHDNDILDSLLGKKLTNVATPPRRASIPQQLHRNAEKMIIVPKYMQKFAAIPEERSSASVDSSTDETSTATNSNNRRCSLPAKIKTSKSGTPSPEKTKDECNESKEEEGLQSPKAKLCTINENVTVESGEFKDDMIRQSHDVSTSPIPHYVSIATSPIPLASKNDSKEIFNKAEIKNNVKGKKALACKEGWAGFCKPQTGYVSDHEGPRLSSNVSSETEALDKTAKKKHTKVIAPPSLPETRTVDSQNNNVQRRDSAERKQFHKTYSNKLLEDSITKEATFKNRKIVDVEVDSKSSKLTNLQRNDSVGSISGHIVKLPSPVCDQSSTRSSQATSGTDSDKTVRCPAIIPKWAPNTVPRYRRAHKRWQRQEEQPTRQPYQNISGGWSVTLAGSCYTTLPSDVEMKVSFLKNGQNQNRNSKLRDDENHNDKVNTTCKNCGNETTICRACQTGINCKCSFIQNTQSQIALPPHNQNIPNNQRIIEDDNKSVRDFYPYLPDVNAMQRNRNSHPNNKTSVKMARRFSLQCWLPEDKHNKRKRASQHFIEESVDELSVSGFAIMPDVKPRVTTMSERDLTRMRTTQLYSRSRYNM